MCADGSALPPSLIYQAAGNDVQASWVEDIKLEEHSAHFATSPSGWTNDELGVAWLEQIFERCTKAKAGRKWWLLIVDGHGSHLTMDWIRYLDTHRILMAILPPHSTHTLQPLDGVLLRPCSLLQRRAHSAPSPKPRVPSIKEWGLLYPILEGLGKYFYSGDYTQLLRSNGYLSPQPAQST